MVLNNAITIDASKNITYDNGTTINFGAGDVNFGSGNLDFGSSTLSNLGVNDLDTFNITAPANNALMAWNNAAGEWQDIQLAPQVYTSGSDLVLDGGAP
jgi:hypothetical protein